MTFIKQITQITLKKKKGQISIQLFCASKKGSRMKTIIQLICFIKETARKF